MPQEVMQDTRIHGYDIPAGTCVMINALAIARDKKSWENAEESSCQRGSYRVLSTITTTKNSGSYRSVLGGGDAPALRSQYASRSLHSQICSIILTGRCRGARKSSHLKWSSLMAYRLVLSPP
ncbi:hypothetical protein PR202_ga05656 [Eleusine coracana subsp. coracana]|uniref:Uncharacterized protein n=1 Tax=Eleusine coracana subsp. coracana TaxID=191504 RepID=A0AAV5BST1_ELECO|nr:hypothetical protein PR202_ga05202 [Eleusine coracana subsp. coracana]GJM89461.1 hypothetical protein PR202_ga05656 [Eleusine coracana subsp. coracana]